MITLMTIKEVITSPIWKVFNRLLCTTVIPFLFLFYLPFLCLHPRQGRSLMGLAAIHLQNFSLYSFVLINYYRDWFIGNNKLLLIPKVFGAEDLVHSLLNLFFVLVSISTFRYCLLYNSEALRSWTKLIEIKLNFEAKIRQAKFN